LELAEEELGESGTCKRVERKNERDGKKKRKWIAKEKRKEDRKREQKE